MYGIVSPLTNRFFFMMGICTLGFGRRQYSRFFLATACFLVFCWRWRTHFNDFICIPKCACMCWFAGPKHVVENIPDYPNFAQDVYAVICDYFGCLVEPLLTFALYDDIVNVIGMFFQK